MPRTINEQLKIIHNEKRIGLMTHVVLGYPSLEESIERIKIMSRTGVDIIEVQLPFSDPVADGPVISQANEVALKNGVTIPDCFRVVKQLSQEISTPLIWVGYYNTILQYGVSKFVADSAAIGIQGFTFPDLPIDEEPYENFISTAKKNNIPVIQLVSPITPAERLQKIAPFATGFIYCVARFGTTGQQTDLSKNIQKYLSNVRQYIKIPLAIGFGISKPEHLTTLKGYADIAVVGSALLEIPTPELETAITKLCQAR